MNTGAHADSKAIQAIGLADARRVMERCEALARHSEEQGRLTRRFATPALAAAMGEVAAWMRAAGMSVRRDNAGNLIGRYEAAGTGSAIDGKPSRPRTLLLGSHLDSVRDAGRYDGPLGVLVALAVIERLRVQARRLPLAIEVVAFADEEGLRYGTSYLGSKAVAGAFDPTLLQRVDDDGVRMDEAIRAAGGDPAAIPADARLRDDLVGYCEAHIEQGPVLEAEGLPVGVVSAIAGQSRFTVTFEGTAGHAGTVPMALRHDALCAAAEFMLAVEALARATPGLVATVGQLAVEPGASNVIPGRAVLSLDVRHQDDATRLRSCDQLRATVGRIAVDRGVADRWDTVQEDNATPCDPVLGGALGQAIASLGLPVRRLPSGAGHDGVVLAALCPLAMLFVRCCGGVSHHPAESVTVEDVAVAVQALARFVENLAAAEPTPAVAR